MRYLFSCSISYTDLRCSWLFVVLSVSFLISFPLSNSMSCSRRRSNIVLWAWIKRRWLSQGRLEVDRWEMQADRQHICRETKAHWIERKKKLMKYIKQQKHKWQKALLGRHNVKSNQADWKFGSSRFSRLCLVVLWPNQKASQITLIAVAKKVPITTAYSLCNLLRQRRAVNTWKLSNWLVSFSFLFPLPCVLLPVWLSGVFWTGCDNGGICNPHFDSPLLIMRCNHKLTIQLGMPIHKKSASNSWNTASNSGSFADGKTVIGFLLSASPAQRAAQCDSPSNTDRNEQKWLEIQKVWKKDVWLWKSIKLTWRT